MLSVALLVYFVVAVDCHYLRSFYWKNPTTFISSHRAKKNPKNYQFSPNTVPHVTGRNGTIVPPSGQDVSPRSRPQQGERHKTKVAPTAAKLYWIIIRVQKNETKVHIKLHSEMSQCVFSVREDISYCNYTAFMRYYEHVIIFKKI